MADTWYYADDANKNKIGPFSGQQLKHLASLGNILPTDTIWKGGVEKGVLASKVKNLFSLRPVIADVPVVEVAALSQLPLCARSAEKIRPAVGSELSAPPEVLPPHPVSEVVSPGKTVATPHQVSAVPKPARKGRAVATKGANIVSQDGIRAKFRKKCTACGHKDVAIQTITITNKTTNAGYYCPKCKKNREVTIQCTSG